MTIDEARELIRECGDDEMDDDTAREIFLAVYGRDPDVHDIEEGIWSHCCAALDDD